MRQLLVLMGAIVAFSSFSLAMSFKGVDRRPAGESTALDESVEHYSEDATHFLISFTHHHAVTYRFPKRTGDAAQVRDFLTSRMKTHRVLHAVVDPVSSEIYNLADNENHDGRTNSDSLE